MPYNREQLQILNSVKKAGNGATATIKLTKLDPMGGSPKKSTELVVHFVQANYTSNDLADPTVVAGLIKIVVPAIGLDGVQLVDFVSTVMDKSAKVKMPNGKSISIKSAKVTMPDGVTPLVARLFLGG